MNCPHGREPERCPRCKEILNGMLTGFRLVGPTETATWAADYFTDVARAMRNGGHAHGEVADRLLEFCGELRALAVRYKPIIGPRPRS